MNRIRHLFQSVRLPTFILLVVSPLVFFTDLTRNPYQIQIIILNIAVLWIAAIGWGAQITEPGDLLEWTGIEILFLALVVWAGITGLLSWIYHPLFRASVLHQGLKGWLFIVINGYLVFQMGRRTGKTCAAGWEEIPVPTILWIAFLWAALWLPYHTFKTSESSLWDPYGGLVWILLFLGFVVWLKLDSTNGGLNMILFVGVIAGSYSLIQHFGRDVIWGSVLDPYGGRAISTFGNPNFLSSSLVMILPIAATLVINARNKTKRLAAIAFLLLTAISLLYTSTRSSWVGGIVALGTLGALSWKDLNPHQMRTLRTLILSGLGLLALWLISPWRAILLEPLARGQELWVAIKTGRVYPAINQRLLIWHCAWDMIRKNPWAGTGWGCFEMFYPFYQGPLLFNPSLNFRTHANNAHNLVLELGSQMGLVGLGLFCALLAFAFLSFRKAGKNQQTASRILLSGMWAGCIGMIADNLLGNVSLFFAAPALLFWWLLGLGNGLAHEPVVARIPKRSLARAAAAFLFLSALGAGVWTWRHFDADRSYYAGFKLSRGGKTPEAIPLLERSLSLDGSNTDNAYELGNNYAQEARLLQASKQPELAREKHEQAIGAYTAAIAANPGYDEIYYNRATELASIGHLEPAYDDLTISLWINPLYRNAYTMLASLTLILPDREDQTLSLLRNGLMFYPDDVNLLNDTGYFLVAAHRLEEARVLFERCLAIDPQSPIARNNLNNVLRQQGQH